MRLATFVRTFVGRPLSRSRRSHEQRGARFTALVGAPDTNLAINDILGRKRSIGYKCVVC